MKAKAFFAAILFAILAPFVMPATLHADGAAEEEKVFNERGIYVYDDRDFLPTDEEVSLAWYLWNLDLRTGYEVVLVFPKEQMNEPQMIEWFNSNGVGKEGRDNGAAVFVLPDNAVFVSIGSGNDKITVTKSKTYGEKIFADFQDDPVLTLLRFLSKIGGDVDKTTAVDTARD